MPVSATVRWSQTTPGPYFSLGLAQASTRTWPELVNFTALPTRLNRIWRRRASSPKSISGTPACMWKERRSFLAAHGRWKIASTDSKSRVMLKGSVRSLTWPAFILEKSSTSVSRDKSLRPALTAMLT